MRAWTSTSVGVLEIVAEDPGSSLSPVCRGVPPAELASVIPWGLGQMLCPSWLGHGRTCTPSLFQIGTATAGGTTLLAL